MKFTILVYILATVLSVAPTQSAQTGLMSASEMKAELSEQVMMIDECAECENCDEEPGMPHCADACNVACTVSACPVILSQLAITPTFRSTIHGCVPNVAVCSALLSEDAPPPKV